MEIRLQKYLSQEGILSRRKAEEAISNGLIFVNGTVVTEMGVKIDPRVDKVTLGEALVKTRRSYSYIKFYKPKGVWSNCAQFGEPEIKDLLPEKYQHLSTIGRLDKESEGLILLTDDGVFANRFLNSDETYEKKYLVWVSQPITESDCDILREGTTLEGAVITKPCVVNLISPTHIVMILTEGKNRQIRRMLRAVGNHVVGLKRVLFGAYTLGDLPLGKYAEIKP